MIENRSKIYFLGDAHLGAEKSNEADSEGKLVEFLRFIEPNASQLFIMGDLFEFWFEYKGLMPKGHIRLLCQLQRMTQKGISIHYIVGNHDFAIGTFLSQEIGMKLYWDPLSTKLQEKKFFMAHGDGLNKKDIGYRILKPILRNKTNQALYRLLPSDWAIDFAKWCSAASRTATDKKIAEKIKNTYRKIAEELLNQGHEVVVLGHTHLPDYVQTEKGIYINVGGWQHRYSYGLLENGKITLKTFNEGNTDITGTDA